ncbi:MAG TPA: DUF4097 family beta strand repeat-containing protein [Pyrinomonadaceae bacterium]|nr:DUF4097 family beta strand repeat-containing protein [Pyrinomonadaceae bacterium]
MSSTLRASLVCWSLGLVIAASSGTQSQQTPVSPVSPVKPDTTKLAEPASDSLMGGRSFGHVSLNVSRGVRVTLGNRSTGRITVTGWDRDVVSAQAVSQRGSEAVIVDQGPAGLFLKADYADLESSDPTGRTLDSPPIGDEGSPIQVHLEVKLPRYAVLELIRVWRSDVQITSIDTPFTIVGEKSSIILKDVGAVEIHTRSGNVEIENATGFIQVTTASGAIRVTNAKAGVRAVSIAGPIEVKCASGRVDVTNTDAPIDFYNVVGDVDAMAANSSVRFDGELEQDGRYHLRSMSGRVEMILPANTGGFNATLSSYRGMVESDFPLKATVSGATKEIIRSGQTQFNRRLSGQFRNQRAQIWLDSFEGLVRLTRRTTPLKGCE